MIGDFLILGLGVAALTSMFSAVVIWCANGKPLLDPKGER